MQKLFYTNNKHETNPTF